MAKQYDDTNRGALFKEQDKQSDKHPDYKGSINVDGTDYWLSAWIKEAESGRKYMSLSVQPKDKQGSKRTATKAGATDADSDPSIPF
ncbi:hypothetical protein M8A51_25725 [Schlegelella sp. S2-27]|uniref:DUF736 domain-containing protein n=1 Tax=Caldimonas mangrovi TaxID=2944811 RepID=A0ABT0YX38_9BURK|nr:hypothetical protein [Caldimonas mangrovi]MCM5682937.1 hypothetical protein [Caldimonas mangrovi]